MALVSVIMANYNKGAFIGDAIESVLYQTLADVEVMVVDDGSTDNSLGVVQSYAARDQRVKLFSRHREPKGGNTCRNIGIEKATGKFLVFLDSDDLMMPFCLQQRVEAMEQTNADVCLFKTGTFYEKIGDSKSFWIPPEANYLHRFLMHDLPWNISSPIWKRAIIEQVNGFDESLIRLQDVDLHTRVLLVCKPVIHRFPDMAADCYYRIAENRIIVSYADFVRNYVRGQLDYVNKTVPLLKANSLEKKCKYLKGSLITALQMPLYNYATKRIDDKVERELYDTVLNSPGAVALLNTPDKWILKIYRLLYRLGIKRKINGLFKKLLVR